MSSARTRPRRKGSSAESGSSSSSVAGLVTRARASATRCCCPPDSCAGSRAAKLSSSTSRSASAALAWRAASADAAHAQGKGDVVQHRQMREQRIGLEHHRRAAAGRRQADDGHVVQQDVAAGRVLVPRQQPQRGGLAAARGAEQADIAAGADPQVQRIDGDRTAREALGDGGEFDRAARLGGGRGAAGCVVPCRSAISGWPTAGGGRILAACVPGGVGVVAHGGQNACDPGRREALSIAGSRPACPGFRQPAGSDGNPQRGSPYSGLRSRVNAASPQVLVVGQIKASGRARPPAIAL